jgi:hypothetical protein
MDKSSFSGDGVITGSGLIAGRPVFVYSQDFTGKTTHRALCCISMTQHTCCWSGWTALTWHDVARIIARYVEAQQKIVRTFSRKCVPVEPPAIGKRGFVAFEWQSYYIVNISCSAGKGLHSS